MVRVRSPRSGALAPRNFFFSLVCFRGDSETAHTLPSNSTFNISQSIRRAKLRFGRANLRVQEIRAPGATVVLEP